MNTFILLDKETSQVLHSTKTKELMMSFIRKYNRQGLVFECNEKGVIIKLVENVINLH